MEENTKMDAQGIMTRAVITAGPDDTVRTLAALFTQHGISAVPVCDKDGTLLGVISEGDLMRPFGEGNMLRRDWWLGLLAEGTDLAPEFLNYVRLDSRRARDLMTVPAITATEHTSASEIADLLQRHRIKRVPIVKDGKVVGIVSRADVVRAFALPRDASVDSI
jgi:CBS domain-containing protein